MGIPMNAVKSSNIAGIGYSAGTLRVEFTNGSKYDYEGVSPEEFEDLRAADADPERSVGSAFHKGIRSKYKGKRLGEE